MRKSSFAAKFSADLQYPARLSMYVYRVGSRRFDNVSSTFEVMPRSSFPTPILAMRAAQVSWSNLPRSRNSIGKVQEQLDRGPKLESSQRHEHHTNCRTSITKVESLEEFYLIQCPTPSKRLSRSSSTMLRRANPQCPAFSIQARTVREVVSTPPGTPKTMPSMESALTRVKRSTVNRTNSDFICRSTPMQRARRSGIWRRKILIVSFRPPTSTLSKVLRRRV